MPGQVCAVKDLTKTFGLPRRGLRRLTPNLFSRLIVGRAGGLGKLVELLAEVNYFFLQICYFPSG